MRSLYITSLFAHRPLTGTHETIAALRGAEHLEPTLPPASGGQAPARPRRVAAPAPAALPPAYRLTRHRVHLPIIARGVAGLEDFHRGGRSW